MFSLHRLLRLSYILVLGASVFLLSRPAPVRAAGHDGPHAFHEHEHSDAVCDAGSMMRIGGMA